MYPFILISIQAKQQQQQKPYWEKIKGQENKVKQIKIYHYVCQTQEGKNIQQARI